MLTQRMCSVWFAVLFEIYSDVRKKMAQGKKLWYHKLDSTMHRRGGRRKGRGRKEKREEEKQKRGRVEKEEWEEREEKDGLKGEGEEEEERRKEVD